MLVFALLWSLFQLGVTMPIANHVSGVVQDLSGFEGLEGNVGMLAGLLVLSWTFAAFGEELAYRGYLLTRIGEAFEETVWPWWSGSSSPRCSSVSRTPSRA